jgi:hypothetical protein
MNPHIDAVPLAHAGRTVTIRFTWRALAVIQREWGDEWSARMVAAFEGRKVEDLSELIAVTAGMTLDDVNDWSPPLDPSIKALYEGYLITKTGEKPRAAVAGDENPPKAQTILSKASAVLQYVLGLDGPSSGTKPPTQPAST